MFKTSWERGSVTCRSWYGLERKRNEACNKGCLKSEFSRGLFLNGGTFKTRKLLRFYFPFIFIHLLIFFLQKKNCLLVMFLISSLTIFPICLMYQLLSAFGVLPLSMLNVGSICRRRIGLIESTVELTTRAVMALPKKPRETLTSTLAS